MWRRVAGMRIRRAAALVLPGAAALAFLGAAVMGFARWRAHDPTAHLGIEEPGRDGRPATPPGPAAPATVSIGSSLFWTAAAAASSGSSWSIPRRA
ncbi:MAG: hypothetical protein HY716_04865 [Planctomycetes bacterium]|nr:hypothetical protein [Planctomycetota bacterium]